CAFKSKQASARIPTPKSSSVGEVLAEPGGGLCHDLAEGRLDINLVVTKAAQGHEFLGLASLGKQRLGFLRRAQAVVSGSDEQNWARGNFVDDPLGMKAQGLVDEFERQFIDRGWIGAARGGGEFGGLRIR